MTRSRAKVRMGVPKCWPLVLTVYYNNFTSKGFFCLSESNFCVTLGKPCSLLDTRGNRGQEFSSHHWLVWATVRGPQGKSAEGGPGALGWSWLPDFTLLDASVQLLPELLM